MAHIHHEEEQRFTQVTWVWVAFAIMLLVTPTALFIDDSTSQEDIIKILLTTGFAALPVATMLLYSKLQLKINEEGIHYRFVPSVFKWRTISKNSIESFEVTAKKTLWEKIECGYGYRSSRLRKVISMNVCGEKIARIKLIDGRRLKIGTINPESMERALRKLTSPDNY